MTLSFSYRNGVYAAEQVSLERIAAEVGTPFYCYSKAQIDANYRAFAEPFRDLNAHIYYAVKANTNLAVIRTLAACGAGADVTSAGELERAVRAGIKPDKIIFSGVAKTQDEILVAMKLGIYQFNAESIPELHVLNEVAGKLGIHAPVALRVNPNVAAHTHFKLATSETGVKFGIDMAQLEEAMALVKSLPSLVFKGFQVHVGTHLNDFEDFNEAFGKLAELVVAWRAKGFTIDRLDLGGGVGIPYDGQKLAPFSDYVDLVRKSLGNLGCELSFEPGRRLVGDAGVLISRVIYDKHGISKRFLILDAGMNDLIRPAMYEARHSIVPVRETKKGDADMLADVVGPVCETGDLFGVDYRLPGVGQGDLVAFLQAGAYGAAMSSNYNGRALVPEVLVDGDSYKIIRRRVSVAEQISWESAEWHGQVS
jgi:diaminopimelate decarboxylase